MKIATLPGFEFQLMGNDLANAIGIEFVASVPTTENLLLFGDQISPDNWCLDVKAIFGSIVKAIESGADTIFLFHYAYPVINYGPCLLPWACDNYFDVAIKKMFPEKDIAIFSGAWWNLTVVSLNITKALKKRGLNSPDMVFKIKKSLEKSWKKICLFQEAKDMYYEIGAVDYAKFSPMYKNLKNIIYNENDYQTVATATKKFIDSLVKEKIKTSKLTKIGVFGDFYSLSLEHYPFFNIEELLMKDLGVSLIQPFTFFSVFDKKQVNLLKKYREKTQKHIKYWMGGSDYYTIPMTLLLKDKKVDGIVHASVFSCHPEAICSNVFKMIDSDEGLPPILELTFDSHTQIEAVKVRLEAFVDMLNAKKNI